jgi:restriction endonuclease S subunit
MFRKLYEIADISLGHPIRERIENTPEGDYFVVQNKDVDKDIGVNKDSLYSFNLKGRTKPRLVRCGDLLFVPKIFRSSLPYSVFVNVDLPNLVAAPTFTILSVNENIIRAEYLNWFINSEAHGGKYFKKNAMGSSILNIPKSVLSEMEIALPTIEQQDQFIKLIQAAKREKEIMETLIDRRRVFMDEVLAKHNK